MKHTILLFFLLLTLHFPLSAQTMPDFIDEMVNEHHFNRATLNTLLYKQAKVKQSILRAISRPGEAKPYYEYRKIFLTQNRIKKGVKFWQQYAHALRRAEQIYGVPSEIIVAIIGVETMYGGNMGSYRVIDALKTLAFHYPKRANFFRGELKAFLLLTREERLNPLTLKGSYAGAMGYGQFMPSSYRNYAIDFDGDGKRDIWNNPVDVIGSVANYLKHFGDTKGWQRGQPIVIATNIKPHAVKKLLRLKSEPIYSIKKLKQMGLKLALDKYDDHLGFLVDLKTEYGKLYWVAFQNFYMITRYNRSPRYAMAVYQLSQAIKTNHH